MRQIFELDVKEIEQIVADKFEVNVNAVTIYVEKEFVGYGLDEHYEDKIVCKIRKEMTS